jgi:tRNA threonylcarbamoyladenosine biosynthesis protein TsaB
MPGILHIDTTTNLCSVALAHEGTLSCLRESREERSHARLLAVFIEEVLKEQSTSVDLLDAIAVSKGPGSYTGLRIGVSTAKGMAYGSKKPLIAVDTLESLATTVSRKDLQAALPESSALISAGSILYCPMIDARRMEVFTALFNDNMQKIESVSAKVIDKGSYQDLLKKHVICFFGNGAAKCREMIRHKNAIFLDGIETSAVHMLPVAWHKWQQKQFEDVAYFEPFYMKEFIATIPKNKVIKT